jgi:release factor glutamine methyltransferase
MEIKNAFENLKAALSTIYDLREATTISRYIFEDLFKIKQIFSQKTLSINEIEVLKTVQKRLLAHEPWQHVVGFADFYGLKMHVSPDVLIPRPETEELVEWILEGLKPQQTVLDIGTGSGCIPIVLKKRRPNVEVFGLDVSKNALEIAQKNALLNKVQIQWLNIDILKNDEQKKIGEREFDVIVSNPPYILESDKGFMQKNVLDFEPHLALFVTDESPLLFYEKIADVALKHLKENGFLYFEIHQNFGKQTVELLEKKGFKNIILKKDLYEADRMVRGNRP